MHFFYFAYLVFVWLELTARLHWVQWHREHPPVGAASSFAHPSGFSRITDMPSVQESAMAAVEHERHRIAQDIHDGVGSHLVGLIASLDANSPLHRRIMMGLECCLRDLKMTVDNMDSSESNIFDALGRLRYRLQPTLQRAGIKIVWKVDVAGPLVAVRPAEITHLMHIVQECLSNVLMHSQATKVRLQCRYELEPEPCLLLEVQDNGIGIAKRDPQEFVGKGLSGMRERAKLLGVPLHISSQAGIGTRVRIYLPVRSASPRAQAEALAQAH
jgi:signal transduction histidine kinase